MCDQILANATLCSRVPVDNARFSNVEHYNGNDYSVDIEFEIPRDIVDEALADIMYQIDKETNDHNREELEALATSINTEGLIKFLNKRYPQDKYKSFTMRVCADCVREELDNGVETYFIQHLSDIKLITYDDSDSDIISNTRVPRTERTYYRTNHAVAHMLSHYISSILLGETILN